MKSLVVVVVFVTSIAGACGSAASNKPITGYRIVSADGSPLTAYAGGAKRLAVVAVMSDGTTAATDSSAQVTWTGPPVVQALPNGSTPIVSALPQPGPLPTAIWLQNPDHFAADELAGVLWALDSGTSVDGTVAVTASVSSGAPALDATASVAINPMPVGDIGRGQATYGSNCASCHGATGQGMAAFPGLNDAPDNVAGDPSWNAPLLAFTAQSDVDNLGESLDPSMPKWLTRLSSAGQLLTPADFSDIYAFLKTQTQ